MINIQLVANQRLTTFSFDVMCECLKGALVHVERYIAIIEYIPL